VGSIFNISLQWVNFQGQVSCTHICFLLNARDLSKIYSGFANASYWHLLFSHICLD
jgi:hypothetical protein